jgi:hypothetical protein
VLCLTLLALFFAQYAVLFLAPTQAAEHARANYLPMVQGPPPNVHDALIYECQCGAVTASPMPDGRVLLTIQDHSRGGATVVGIDDGVTFTELGDEPQRAAAPAPAFQFPGEKQGVGSSLFIWGKIVTWAPNRTEPGGHYNIWRDVYEGS